MEDIDYIIKSVKPSSTSTIKDKRSDAYKNILDELEKIPSSKLKKNKNNSQKIVNGYVQSGVEIDKSGSVKDALNNIRY